MMSHSPELLTQILSAFQAENAVALDSLDPKEETFLRMKRIERLFTCGVALLRGFRNPRISNLATNIWQVFEHRHTVLAVGPPVASLSFAAVVRQGVIQAMVLAPADWYETAIKDPVMQVGAILFTGSQAVDFYNG